MAKLEWRKESGSDRQFADAVAIAVAQELDHDYLNMWAKDLGIDDQLQAVFGQAAIIGKGGQ